MIAGMVVPSLSRARTRSCLVRPRLADGLLAAFFLGGLIFEARWPSGLGGFSVAVVVLTFNSFCLERQCRSLAQPRGGRGALARKGLGASLNQRLTRGARLRLR